MKAAKRKPRRKRAPVLARRAPPDVYSPAAVSDDDRIYVRLPLSAEMVGTLREHADNARALVAILDGTGATLEGLLGAFSRAAAAVARDVDRVRRARRRRR